MTVFDENWWYAIKCLALVFVVAPCIMGSCGLIVCAFANIITRLANALHLHRMALPRCKKCKFYGMVQCPMHGKAEPNDFCSKGEKWNA